MVNLNFSITEKDLFYFYDDRSRHQGIWIKVIMYIILLILLFLPNYKDILYWDYLQLIPFFIFLGFMILFLFTWHAIIFILKMSGSLNKMLEKWKRQTIVFDDKEMHHTFNDWSKALIPYTVINKIVTTKYGIYLFASDIHVYIIPITAFNNNSDLEFVKNKLSSNTK